MKKYINKKNVNTALKASIPIASTGLAAANFITNKNRHEKDKIYQERQLKAMEELTDTIRNTNKSLDSINKKPIEKKEENKKKLRIYFFQKNHSNTVDYAIKGGSYGLAAGTIMSGIIPKKINTEDEPDKGRIINFYDKYSSNPIAQRALLAVSGLAIGATLGAIAGAIVDASEFINKKTTVNNRLMKDILDNLKKMGLTENKDYTRDPKKSNLMKTKICLVISRSGGELKLLINTANDPKLKDISTKIIKNLPSSSVVTEKASDRFNELNISTISNNNGDSVFISCIAEKFIKSGFPVYLIEIG